MATGAHYLPPSGWYLGSKNMGHPSNNAVRIAETWIGSDRETSLFDAKTFSKSEVLMKAGRG